MKIALPLILVVALLLLFHFRKDPPPEVKTPLPVIVETSAPSAPTPAAEGPNGNDFLADHGAPSTRPVEDLQKVQRATEGFLNLFKTLDSRYYATNEQLTAVLTGDNREKLQWLDPSLPIFTDGKLTDRWGTPYLIHPLGQHLLEIRSFGPDKISGTDDDLTLHPDGRVLKGKID